MSKTGSKGSASTMVALTAGGAVLVLVSAALGQGVQGPNTSVAPGTLQPGAAAGALNTYNKGTGAGGAVDTFNKGTTGAAGFIWFNKGGPGAAGAVDAFNKGNKAAGAEPPPSPSKATGMGNFESKQSGSPSVPVGPRAAGYLKSPTKGDPKAKLGDIKGESFCATGKVC